MSKTVTILGVAVDGVDNAGMLDQIAQWVDARRETPCARQVCTVNPEYLVDARRDPTFAAVLAGADLRVADGAGVLWAARRCGRALRERVTGSDGIYRISERAARRGWRVFFLGAAPGVAARAATLLRERCPGLIIAGAYAGNPMPEEWPAIAGWLAATQPDILFVAYGHPRQDRWIAAHRCELHAAVAIGVGGAFDFVAGVQRRAPTWLQRLNLEWLYRLLREPRRWKRMLKLPVFVWMVLTQHQSCAGKSREKK
jgi:N-acetylglucosaminyldiphosphoundecaprenol N-acetyl-beta-D-mannosaminyltransferase